MKQSLGAAIAIATAFLSFGCSPQATVPPAQAQQVSAVGDWTDPSGQFSLSYVDRGWRLLSPHRYPGGLLEIAGPSDREGRVFMCAVLTPERGGLLHTSQEQINADMRRRTVEADVPQQWRNAADFRFAHATVDGVALIDMSFSNATMYQRWRSFRLPGRMGSAQHQLTCAVTLPVTDEERAEVEAIVTSLHFSPER